MFIFAAPPRLLEAIYRLRAALNPIFFPPILKIPNTCSSARFSRAEVSISSPIFSTHRYVKS